MHHPLTTDEVHGKLKIAQVFFIKNANSSLKQWILLNRNIWGPLSYSLDTLVCLLLWGWREAQARSN